MPVYFPDGVNRTERTTSLDSGHSDYGADDGQYNKAQRNGQGNFLSPSDFNFPYKTKRDVQDLNTKISKVAETHTLSITHLGDRRRYLGSFG